MPVAPRRFQPVTRGTLRFKPPEEETRLSSDERGYNSKWRRARQAFLAKHPLCVKCWERNRPVPACVVDHITPHRIGDAIASQDQRRIIEARRLFWDSTNWQSLCTTCHNSTKQAEENAARRAALSPTE